MNTKQWQEVQDIFEKVRDLDEKQRSAALEKACAGNKSLIAEVESLLYYHDRSGSFLEGPAVRDMVDVIQENTGASPLPRAIGPYRIHKCLGKGGMGSVYAAGQTEPVKRKVALKVINLGLDREEFLARFRYEYQALALLNHANIAHVYDAGRTEDGRPFFAMEFINGLPLTDYCDREKSTLEERLHLFLQVCDGVQHAHRRGVIHRDLKPSNILVTLDTAKPVPKIIDFGIAITLGESDRKKTRAGMILGTPAYMSPEQAEHLDVDTGSDVYALGIVLYELLTGHLPLADEAYSHLSPTEMLRIIKEEDTPKPSHRLAKEGEAVRKIADLRQTTPTPLLKQLNGDPDWIVLKAVEKERGRRYGSVTELAADIHRYLEDQPVQACPPSKPYLIRKFIRRHKSGALATFFFTLALLMAIAGLTAGFYEADKGRHIANKANSILEKVLKGIDPRNDSRDNASNMLYRASKELDNLEDPAIEAKYRVLLGNVYSAWGDYAEAREQFEKALDIRVHLLGPHHRDTLKTHHFQALILMRQKHLAEAEKSFRSILGEQKWYLGPKDSDTLVTMTGLADTLRMLERYPEAQVIYEKAYLGQKELHGEGHNETLVTMNNMANNLIQLERYVSAEELIRKTLTLRQKNKGDKHILTLEPLHMLALVLERQRKLGEAEKFARQAFNGRKEVWGLKHPDTLGSANNLALILTGLQKAEEALSLKQYVFETRKDTLGRDDLRTLKAMNNLADGYLKLERYTEAVALKMEEEEIKDKAGYKDNIETLFCSLTLGEGWLGLDEPEEAESVFRKVVTGLEDLLPSDSRRLGQARHLLGISLMVQKRWEDAIVLFTQTIVDLEESPLKRRIQKDLEECKQRRVKAMEG